MSKINEYVLNVLTEAHQEFSYKTNGCVTLARTRKKRLVIKIEEGVFTAGLGSTGGTIDLQHAFTCIEEEAKLVKTSVENIKQAHIVELLRPLCVEDEKPAKNVEQELDQLAWLVSFEAKLKQVGVVYELTSTIIKGRITHIAVEYTTPTKTERITLDALTRGYLKTTKEKGIAQQQEYKREAEALAHIEAVVLSQAFSEQAV